MSSALQAKKVLFVDDEGMLVTLGAAMLAALGYQAQAYERADEAIAAFTLNPHGFMAAFTDLTMPQMSGFEVARKLLSIRGDLPVFLMSGNLGRENELAAREIGVRETVLKPISMDQLRAMLARVA